MTIVGVLPAARQQRGQFRFALDKRNRDRRWQPDRPLPDRFARAAETDLMVGRPPIIRPASRDARARGRGSACCGRARSLSERGSSIATEPHEPTSVARQHRGDEHAAGAALRGRSGRNATVLHGRRPLAVSGRIGLDGRLCARGFWRANLWAQFRRESLDLAIFDTSTNMLGDECCPEHRLVGTLSDCITARRLGVGMPFEGMRASGRRRGLQICDGAA